MLLRYSAHQLKFRDPFTISKGTKTHQPTLLVSLRLGKWTGYGEAPAITYYNISVEQMIADLEQKRMAVEKFAFTDPERYWHYLHHLFPQNPFLVCALDMAGWDLFGKMRGVSLQKLFNGPTGTAPLTDYTIGIDSQEKMLEKMLAKPWPIYKIKVGTVDDLTRLKAIRANTQSTLRVDANAAWSLETALQLLPALEELGVELVEQPLAKEDWEGMSILYKRSPLPLIADESCVGLSDVPRCADLFHGINIKLTKCSGLTPARQMIEKAKDLKLKIMLGSMNESSVGTAALAHLLPFVDYADLDGPLLLDEDLATGIEFDNGRVIVSSNAGLGVDLNF
ncbi:MAG: dipeptide epimerase [Sphingomonadales bacterium]|nr:dipeptide epimerase [Sphingomonadales bacterium]